MNKILAHRTLEELCRAGMLECCICPGARNGELVTVLPEYPLKTHFWFEERSAAFFALGRSRRTSRPVGVITTSGTAVAELLPATMEAYYTAVPLILITADRPRKLRGTGAPQAAEHVGIFSCYAPTTYDIAFDEPLDLLQWKQKSPAHLNVCFEERDV